MQLVEVCGVVRGCLDYTCHQLTSDTEGFHSGSPGDHNTVRVYAGDFKHNGRHFSPGGLCVPPEPIM